MKIALLSDIHANLEAFEAVLSDVEQHHVDRVVCLGDTIGYGPDPLPCLDLAEKICQIRLMGNHEFAVIGKLSSNQVNSTAKISLRWTHDQLTEAALPRIANLPLTATADDLLFVHASPYEPEKWRYVLSPADAENAFKHFEQRICFNGHSHLPMIFALSDNQIRRQTGHDFCPSEETRYIVNVGSVGQPRDNDPRACYVTYDVGEQEILFHRVEYDIAKAQHKMKQAELPAMLIQRLQAGV